MTKQGRRTPRSHLGDLRRALPYRFFVWMFRLALASGLFVIVVGLSGALNLAPKPVANTLILVGMASAAAAILAGGAVVPALTAVVMKYLGPNKISSEAARRYLVAQVQVYRDIFFLGRRK